MERRLQSLEPGTRARDGSELVELLRRIGDLREDEIAARVEEAALSALPQLLADGRIARITIARITILREERFICADEIPLYTRLLDDDLAKIVSRYIGSHAIAGREEILDRYPLDEESLTRIITKAGFVGIAAPKEGWADPRAAEGIRRITISLRRRRVKPVEPASRLSQPGSPPSSSIGSM